MFRRGGLETYLAGPETVAPWIPAFAGMTVLGAGRGL